REPAALQARVAGRPDGVHRACAGQLDASARPVQASGAGGDDVRLQRRLLFAAEPGAALGAAVGAGPAPGDHGLPAAGTEADVTPLQHRPAVRARANRNLALLEV